MRIRRAVGTDSEALTALAHRAKASWGYPAELMDRWDAALSIPRDFIDAHDTFVAEADGAPLGVYALCGAGDELELEHFWVDPDAQRSGVGRSLFDHATGRARARGADSIRIASDPHAEGFYLRMGAVRVGDEETLVPGRSLPVLRLALGHPAHSSTSERP